MKKIPDSFKVGGQRFEVRHVDRCDDNTIGSCVVAGGYIEIAEKFSKDGSQSEDCKANTFYHELTHAILRTMGETELNDNEKFVCCFSSFLTEAMEKAYFTDKEDDIRRTD